MTIDHVYLCVEVDGGSGRVVLSDESGKRVTVRTAGVISDFQVGHQYSIHADYSIFAGVSSLEIRRVS